MTETKHAAWPDQLGRRLLKERIVVLVQEVDIQADSDRDRWFTAQETLEHGFVDRVAEGMN
ncbi:ATP-dependent Clp protease proteolytic subunit [Nonomuraea sp. AD125B]|uniref:ATP-dependent Clp protease proteolytic subunit n=1 Tax=Nonomuraea sp. AD125B TaxID=3242897 RepID=UPI003527782F